MGKMKWVFCVVLFLSGLWFTGMASGGDVPTAMALAANRLINDQNVDGSWTGETEYLGSMVAGLVNAYNYFGVPSYKTSANSAGTYIQTNTSFTGDEAYALSLLSSIADNPSSNTFRTSLTTFFNTMTTNGTQTKINELNHNVETSEAVLYISRYTVAAYYVNNVDKNVWRDNLIATLAKVTTEDYYPVGSLGLCVWALAKTGALDSTVISTDSSSYWYNKTLAELPTILASHQVSSGSFANSFYWRLDHTNGGNSIYHNAGYMEDTIWGVLGLISAYEYDPVTYDYADEISKARSVIADGIDGMVIADGSVPDGYAYDHIWNGSSYLYLYTGEALEALPEPTSLVLFLGGLFLVLRRRWHG